MAPRPSFNDGSEPVSVKVVIDDKGTVELHESLRTPVSTYKQRVRYCVYEFDELLDSSSIDSRGWTQIATTIYRNYELFDGFVILHGTDSLAYTSSALSFMLQDLGKPVILTGSQAPMLELQNDATDNLLGSIVIAGHFVIPEVCLYFNYNLLRGNRATKTSATEFAAFSSPNHPPLATTSAINTKILWPLVHRATRLSALTLQPSLHTAHVACLRVFPGIKPEMVEAVLRVSGLQGLILETFGAGNAPGGPDGKMTQVLAEAVGRGIIIVNVTQCLSGVVSPLYAPATILGRAGVVFGHDMTSEAALTKLSYLLAVPGLSQKEICRLMATSLRGELTESSKTLFRHPEESELRASVVQLTMLMTAIAEGNVELVREQLHGQEWLVHEADYSANTPLHVAASAANPAVVHLLLSVGASVHARNGAGHTPLYVAVAAGLEDNAAVMRQAGGHLHSHERKDSASTTT